jgi:dihydrofolate synthase/folylpolyglutamate synthase
VLAVDESGSGPEIVFDGAHNPGAAEALANALEGGKRKTAIVFAAMKDKEHAPIFESLARLNPVSLVLTSIASSRSASPGELAEPARQAMGEGTKVETVEKPEEALAVARREAGAGGRVLVTGSLYLVGRLREKLLGAPETIG